MSTPSQSLLLPSLKINNLRSSGFTSPATYVILPSPVSFPGVTADSLSEKPNWFDAALMIEAKAVETDNPKLDKVGIEHVNTQILLVINA